MSSILKMIVQVKEKKPPQVETHNTFDGVTQRN